MRREWYDQIKGNFGHILDVNVLSKIFQKIIVPDLNNPLVGNALRQWAQETQPIMIGGLLAAASQSSDETWQSMMQLLQSRLAYRWMIEHRMDTLWNPGLLPEPGSDSGRNIFRRRRN